MWNLHKIIKVLLVGAVSATLACCGEEEQTMNGPTPGDATDRTYLEQAASQFMALLAPNDQNQAISALSHFVYLCQNYDFPDNFSDSQIDALTRAGADFQNAMEQNDLLGVSRAASELVYNLARFKGLYQANSNTKQWQMIEDRDHVDFRFWIKNVEYDIVVTGLGGSWSASIPDDFATYLFEVPKNLQLGISVGQSPNITNIVTSTLQTDGKDSSYLNTSISLTFANIIIDATVKCTNTSLKEDMTVLLQNVSTYVRTRMLVSSLELTGNDICSISAWQNFAKSQDPATDFAAIISKGSSTLDVIDMVRIKTETTDTKTLYNYTDEMAEQTPQYTQSQAESMASQIAAAMTGKLYYAGEISKVRADLGWEAYKKSDYSDANDWGIRPTITFTSDDATYDFASYFGGGRFLSVERQYTSLFDQYRSIWNNKQSEQ